VHLTQEAVEALFGPGYQLTERNPLSQPGQFACNETVTIVGPKRQLEKVRILGPVRPDSQVEISRTDEFYLGLDAPVRASGDVANSPGCVLVGTHGKYELKNGVICAWRHIHMHPDDAEYFGVADKDVVEVGIGGTGRGLVFGDVLVRVSPKYKLEMHIDTDEGNAAELSSGAEGALVSTSGLAYLTRRRTKYDTVS
jgi:acetate kinase